MNTETHLCKADIPKPWNTLDALIDAMSGLAAHQIHEMNICWTEIQSQGLIEIDTNADYTKVTDPRYTIR